MTVINPGHPPVKSKGIGYSNHHLQPFTYVASGQGREGANLVIRVSFMSHVYSKADSADASEIRFKDEGGKFREFCPVRHAASLYLPAICKRMIEHNFTTWISDDYNQKSNMTVTQPQPVTGMQYAVFYSVFPSSSETIDIEVLVKSAYEKYINMAHHLKREKVMQVIKKSYYNSVAIPK